jgi:ACR3 family arsenite transporter
MVYPMMVSVDFASLAHIGEKPKGLVVTLVVNWLVKPFTMAGLALLFFEGCPPSASLGQNDMFA